MKFGKKSGKKKTAANEPQSPGLPFANDGSSATVAMETAASIIHPGTPLNPKEKNLKKWIKRAEQFNT